MVGAIFAAVASPYLPICRTPSRVPPAPTPPTLPVLNTNPQVSDLATPPGLKILQFNAKGLLGKLDQLLAFMRSHSIAVPPIQETK
ncbi:unnamed protein product [Dibothriocephalus latus]|uniref:Uncharacterized protein n=1 Tax=Dibothriocephalus latus TaxID=60516 RepID=A0A3P7NS15_DIBLA|nr:unnamed protein product [Dibothriocephalus latus]